MNIEFRIYELKENSPHWKHLKNFNKTNEFIIVGVEGKFKELKVLKAHQLDESSDLVILPGFKLDEITYLFEEQELVPTDLYVEFDIPKKLLTLGIMEEIQKYSQGE